MNPRALQALWQDQPMEEFELEAPPTSRAAGGLDYALPTSAFSAPRPPPSRVFAFASAAAVLVLGVAVVFAGWSSSPLTPSGEGPPAPLGKLPGRDPLAQLENALAECRTFSSPEGTPDWRRAQTACDAVLELEPIHQEANALLKRIKVLSACEANLKTAEDQLSAGRLESASGSLEKIDRQCELYLLRAMALAKSTAQEVKKQSGDACSAYAKAGRWDLALERCEVYARYACQLMSPGELYPPALMRLKVRGPLDPKRDWRPSDVRYLTFLEARQKVTPSAPTWKCPELPAFRVPPAAGVATSVANDFPKRSTEPAIGRALTDYFQGDLQSAPVHLQRVLEQMSRAQHHAQARELLLDMNQAINVYSNGLSELTNGRTEEAAALFRRALALDARLVLGDRATTLTEEERERELSRRQSFVRRSIVDSMVSSSYEKGKTLADRKDFRAACRVWKLGSTFSRADIDLLRALTNVCTARAQDAFESAQSCEQLRAVVAYAVDGDGFKEKVEARLEAQVCR